METKSKLSKDPDHDEFSYGYLLQVLAGSLYPNKMHVLRECIQNSYDSLKEYFSITTEIPSKPIEVFIKGSSVFIKDLGMGMDEQKIHEFIKIGFSNKKPEESVGFQGIGKLAGISVAKKLIITTSMLNNHFGYTLVFDADGALNELKKLKAEGKNPTLNYLIKKFTAIEQYSEKKDKHYTFLELKDIKKDSGILLNEAEVISYIARHGPVPFDPNFEYANKIDERLQICVNDYWSISILVNNKEVFKPYFTNIETQEFIEVKLGKNKVAYCWYCINKDNGQLEPVKDAGLIFRYKNFRVGDNNLARNMLWDSDSHLSLWFFGEIHICNNYVMPTAERDNFQQTTERENFYRNCNSMIADPLSELARGQSGVNRFTRAIGQNKKVIGNLTDEINKGIAQEVKQIKIYQLMKIEKDITRRLKEFKKKSRKKSELKRKPKPEKSEIKEGKELIKKAKTLLKTITLSEQKNLVYDIKKDLKLNEQASIVYTIIVDVLKEYFDKDPKTFEEILKRIQQKLKEPSK